MYKNVISNPEVKKSFGRCRNIWDSVKEGPTSIARGKGTEFAVLWLVV